VARPLREPASLRHPVLDLLGVSAAVHADRTLAARSGLPVLFESEAEGLGALAREGPFPRAFLCGGARVVPDAAERLGLLAAASSGAADPGGDPRRLDLRATVLLETPPSSALPERGGFLPVTAAEAWRAGGGRHELAVAAPFAGLLVLAEGWDPGWQADVDGRQVPVLVADHALLAVELPAGDHHVVSRAPSATCICGRRAAVVASR
jgi:hypothetical protein